MPEFLSLALIIATAVVLLLSKKPTQGDNFIIAALCGLAVVSFLLSF